SIKKTYSRFSIPCSNKSGCFPKSYLSRKEDIFQVPVHGFFFLWDVPLQKQHPFYAAPRRLPKNAHTVECFLKNVLLSFFLLQWKKALFPIFLWSGENAVLPVQRQ